MSHSEKFEYWGRFELVDMPVVAHVVAVGVADDVRVKQRVVERRVEDPLLRTGPAPDADPAEHGVPLVVALGLDLLERPARIFGGDVASASATLDERDPDLHLTVRLAGVSKET